MSEREINEFKEMGLYTDIDAYGTSAVLELASWVASIVERLKPETLIETQWA